MKTIEQLAEAFLNSWSLKSSSKWSMENPAKGQCGVTALVAHDILGGEIRKTLLPEGWHYYNVMHNVRFDFTQSQFDDTIIYEDVHSNREEAFTDTNSDQYNYLKTSVQLALRKKT